MYPIHLSRVVLLCCYAVISGPLEVLLCCYGAL